MINRYNKKVPSQIALAVAAVLESGRVEDTPIPAQPY